MKNSAIYVKIDLGAVLDQTRMSAEETAELLEVIDLNLAAVTPLYHVLTDIDTERVVAVQDFKNGLTIMEGFYPL